MYNYVNLGGAQSHPDKGKRFDLSEDTNKNADIDDSSVILYPVDGYGNPALIRSLIKLEKPDAIFLITDPRYFEWLFYMENEIRKDIPIIYLNIWDDFPSPHYNKAFYESCDLLMGISKQTRLINELVLNDKAKNKILDYVPHGINTNNFFPIGKDHIKYNELQEFKNALFKGKQSDFTLLFNSRNIRRKQIPDTLLAWKYFIDKLPKEKADKCHFVLHTQPVEEAGTDLWAVKEALFGPGYENILFSANRIPPNIMNLLYNVSDAQILLSSNEGWGLALTEAMIVGKPFIANVTGGMQDQMRFEDENGEWFNPSLEIPSNHTGKFQKHGKWAFPVFPKSRSLQGSPKTPYIWDDRCEAIEAGDQILKLYNMAPKEREEIGEAGRIWALSREAGFTASIMGERIIDNIDKLFETWVPRKSYELINANTFEPDFIRHRLFY